jgi:hypothetical protein
MRCLLNIQALRKIEEEKRVLRRREVVAALDDEPEVCVELFYI